MTPNQIGTMLSAVVDARSYEALPTDLFELVLSGPSVQNVPTRDTAAVVHSLIEDAQHEIILVTYSIYRGKELFGRLAQRLDETPDLNLEFYLNIGRKKGDTSLSSEIVKRYVRDFRKYNWPRDVLPSIYYDPRALSDDWSSRSALHAKGVVIDGRTALLTSANFSEAAQKRNVEVGVLINHAATVERLRNYLIGLREDGGFVPVS
ncbi:MAG: hypothetical protein HN341_18680 [Verrucomicrobia bacterium]|nr:hypothetical protein [Verrucomicrobiota bacterium]